MIYHVIANDGRVTVIEADSYALLSNGEYAFTNKTEEPGAEHKVASVNAGATFAVIEDDAFLGSFYPDDEDLDDDENEDDICLDCRIDELLESEDFYEAVVGVIESHCGGGDAEDTPLEAEPPVPEVPGVPKVNHYRYKDGAEFWGFVAPEDPTQIVDFSQETYAKTGASAYSQGCRAFFTIPVSETTLVEDGQ